MVMLGVQKRRTSMAITKLNRKNGSKYQVKLRGFDGKWVTKTFDRKKDAVDFEIQLKINIKNGVLTSGLSRKVTLNSFFELWLEETSQASKGWKKSQKQMYRDYISPIIGNSTVVEIKPFMIDQIIKYMKNDLKRSSQTQRHVYNLIHKMMKDAILKFQLISTNPVQFIDKPKVIKKETKYLSIEEIKKLLKYSDDKFHGLAIWIQSLCGLRQGELQALKWENVDLPNSRIFICENYCRKESRFVNYTKSRKNRYVPIPKELLHKLKIAKLRSQSQFVCTNQDPKSHMTYSSYNRYLKKYCNELGINVISTHGLRHTTSEIYLNSGGSRDDLRILFNHSSQQVTDIYTHDKGDRLQAVANKIELFGS